jgi:hypothetical protein
MVRADHLAGSIDVMMFRDGVKPFWEDENNTHGGRWTMRIRKQGSHVLWEEVLMAIVGEQLDGNEVMGAVLSVRYHDDHISVWNRSADNEAGVTGIRCVARASPVRVPAAHAAPPHTPPPCRDVLQRLLGLPPWIPFDYTRHRRERDPEREKEKEREKERERERGPNAGAGAAGGGGQAGPAPSVGSGAPFASGDSREGGGVGGQVGGGWRGSQQRPPPTGMEAVPLTLAPKRPLTLAPVMTAPAPSTHEGAGEGAGTGGGGSSNEPHASPWAKPTTPWAVPRQAVGAPELPSRGGGPSWSPPLEGSSATSPEMGGRPGPAIPPLGAGPQQGHTGSGGARRAYVGGSGPRPSGVAVRGAQLRPAMRSVGGAGGEEGGWETVPGKK